MSALTIPVRAVTKIVTIPALALKFKQLLVETKETNLKQQQGKKLHSSPYATGLDALILEDLRGRPSRWKEYELKLTNCNRIRNVRTLLRYVRDAGWPLPEELVEEQFTARGSVASKNTRNARGGDTDKDKSARINLGETQFGPNKLQVPETAESAMVILRDGVFEPHALKSPVPPQAEPEEAAPQDHGVVSAFHELNKALCQQFQTEQQRVLEENNKVLTKSLECMIDTKIQDLMTSMDELLEQKLRAPVIETAEAAV